ncbi:MAG: ABC transporter permease [Anaerolineales bacterium]|jgi:ABC-2 type transport system permease protein
MKNSRLRSIIRKEFIQIRRDPRTLALIILIPVIQLFLLGYAATNDVRNVPMAVYDLDRSPASRELLEAYQAADYFILSHDIDSEEELKDLIEKGEARLGIIIPPDFGTQIKGGGKTEIAIVLDGSDPSVASTALSAAQLIGQAYGADVQAERLRNIGVTSVGEAPLEVRTQVWYNPNLEDAYFMVPGIVGMVLFAITSIVTANAIVRERERGTIEQLIVTPIRPWELIIGKITPYVILALFNTVEVLAIGALWFGVPIRGSMALILALSSLFLLSSLGIGLLASTIANTQQEAMLTVYMTLLPAIFLSGFFFPLEAMPKFLQLVSYFVPLRYYLSIIRALLLKGVGIAALQHDVIALTIFGTFLMVAASLRFRKRLD